MLFRSILITSLVVLSFAPNHHTEGLPDLLTTAFLPFKYGNVWMDDTWELLAWKSYVESRDGYLSLMPQDVANWTPRTADFSAGEFYQTETISDTLRLAQIAPNQYFTYGVFTSTVFDAGSTVDWTDVEWESTGVTFWIAMEFRTGNAPVPDGSWQAWSSPHLINGTCRWSPEYGLEICQSHLGNIGNGRYLQYRATLSSYSSSVPTTLYNLKIIYNLYYKLGTATSVTISPANLSQWQDVSYTATVPYGTSLTVDVISPDGSILISDIASGGCIATIDPSEHSSIRLRATLSTSDPSLTPRVDVWSVRWVNGARLYLPIVVR